MKDEDRRREAMIDTWRRALDQRLEALDGETRRRLARIRRQVLERAEREGALEQKGKKAGSPTVPASSQRRWAEWGGLAAVAASALLVVALGWQENVPPLEPPLVEDLELLSTKEEIDFFEELDFYLWLVEEQLDESRTG